MSFFENKKFILNILTFEQMNNDFEYIHFLKRGNLFLIYLVLKKWVYQIDNMWENVCQKFVCLLNVCMSNRLFWECVKNLMAFLKVYMSNWSFPKKFVKLDKIFEKTICEIDKS